MEYMEYTYSWVRPSSAQHQKTILCNIKRVHNKVAKHQIPCPLLKTDGILPFSYYPYAFNTVSGSDAKIHCYLLPSQPCSSQPPLLIRADIWAVQIVAVRGWKEQDRDRGRIERVVCCCGGEGKKRPSKSESWYWISIKFSMYKTDQELCNWQSSTGSSSGKLL